MKYPMLLRCLTAAVAPLVWLTVPVGYAGAAAKAVSGHVLLICIS